MRAKQRNHSTEIMTDEEVLLFCDIAMENGAEPQEAIEDMRMIDALLTAKRVYLSSLPYVRKTSRGYLRKNSTLFDLYEGICCL